MGKKFRMDDEPSYKNKGSHRRGKGHQSRHGKSESELWEERFEAEDLYEEPMYTPRVEPKVVVPPPAPAPQTIQYGPNTHEVKGFKIDFDRVDNIEQLDSEHNGKMTYGIKFLFSGKKGLSKVVWFGTNRRERDRIYAIEYKFWLGVK